MKTLLLGLCLALGSSAQAQQVPCSPGSTGFPCGSQIDSVQITAAPAEFSLQARVAQAKIALGKGLFEQLTVKVLEGSTLLCQEKFEQVRVENGVINLRIGREMSCDLGQVVTERSNLSLQICPGGAQCLPPMDFGAVPSALEANVASRARKAHRADVAAQAHYAARLDADTDVAVARRVRQGYFEVAPSPASTLTWNPVRRPTARTLVLGSRRATTGELLPLGRVAVAADYTEFQGSLDVHPRPGQVGLSVPGGALQVYGSARISGTLSVGRHAKFSVSLDVAGAGTVGVDTAANQDARAGTLSVVAGGLTLGVPGGAVLSTDRLVVASGTTVQGLATFKRDLRAGTSLRAGSVVIPAPKLLLGSGGVAGLVSSGGVKSVTRGNVVIAQLINGNLEFAPPGSRIARVRLRTGIAGSKATFQDAVTLPTDLSCPFGKVRDQVSGACVDVDECATGEAACGANATCANKNPGYTCTCKTGFIGNGYICTPK